MFSRKKVKITISSLILITLCFTTIAYGYSPFPTPTSDKYINDYVGIIDSSTRNQLISIGKELEDKTSAQAVIVIINSTNNIPIEDYANKLFRTWGIGSSNQDNGLLILLSMKEKKWRIEVGRGLEGVLPDLLTNSIMVENAKPYFIENNYGEGLLQSYSVFADTIAIEYNTTLDKAATVPHTSSHIVMRNKGILAGGVFIFILLFDIIFNRGRLLSLILQLIFWNNLNGRGGPGGGRGGYGGGYGGGSSNGGGSSGGW